MTGQTSRDKRAPTPRWVKVSAVVAFVLILLLIGMLLAGHDPARHMAEAGAAALAASPNDAPKEDGKA
jgi:hypothetical protein